MYRRLIKNEWRNLFAEKSFRLIALLFSLLLGYGVFSGSDWFKENAERNRIINENQEKNFTEKRTQTALGFKGSNAPGNFQADPSDPYALGMSLYTAVLPTPSSALLSLGQADILSSKAGVTVSTLQRTKADKTGLENPLSFLAGRLDLSFVVIYLLPLFIFALSFNLLSNEREQGILQLLLSQPISLKKLLTAKITAYFILIFILVAGVSLLSVFIAAPAFSTDFAWRLALWMLLVAGYALFWLALSALINSFGQSSAANALITSALWLVLVLILPALLNIAISAAYPIPPRSEMVSALRSVNLDMRKDGNRLLSEHYQDHPELIPKSGQADVNDFSLAFVYIQREQKKRITEAEEKFSAQLSKQQNLVKKLQFLSPSIIAQEASNDLAGTGLSRYARFHEQAKNFDNSWAEFFLPRIYRTEKLTPEDFDRIPRFEFVEESFASIVRKTAPGILFLLLAATGLLLTAFYKLKTYRLER